MSVFAVCLCTHKYDSLIISGNPSAEDIEQAWLMLLSEYQELKGGDFGDSEHWKITCQIIRNQHHLLLVQTCINVLDKEYSASLIDSLRKLGYRFKTTSENPQDYRQQLYVIVNQAKTKILENEQLTIELKTLLSSYENQDTTVATFEGMLVCFEEMQKTTYDLDAITVSKFIALEKKYNNYIEQLQMKSLKHGNG